MGLASAVTLAVVEAWNQDPTHACGYGGKTCDTAHSFHPDAYCNSMESHCTGNCGGIWCPHELMPFPEPTPQHWDGPFVKDRCIWGRAHVGGCRLVEHKADEYCDALRDHCVKDCDGTWCGDVFEKYGLEDTPVPTPKPTPKPTPEINEPDIDHGAHGTKIETIEHHSEESHHSKNHSTHTVIYHSVHGGVHFVSDRCVWGGAHSGACLSTASHVDQPFCDGNRSNCRGSCEGTWCGDVTLPTDSPVYKIARGSAPSAGEERPMVHSGSVPYPNRCVWGRAHTGACHSAEHTENAFCDGSRETCVDECLGTWCGDVTPIALDETTDTNYITKIIGMMAIFGSVLALIGIVNKSYRKQDSYSLIDDEVVGKEVLA